MNFIFRALKSLKERVGRTIIVLAVMLTVCIVVLAGFSIKSATEEAAILARRELGATVTLTVDQQKMMEAQREQSSSQGSGQDAKRMKFTQTPVPLGYLDELVTSEYVESYSATTSSNANIENITAVGNEETEEVIEQSASSAEKPSMGDKMPGMGITTGDFTLIGTNDFNTSSATLSGENTLVTGREITDEDLNSNVIMIEETFATENNLEVGSTVVLVNPQDETSTIEVEIVGIYKSTAEISEMAYRMTSMLPYNQIYAPYTLVNTFKGEGYEDAVDSIVFYLNDPANVEAFIEEGNNTSIDFNTYKLDANNQAYETMMGPIENVASFSNTTLILVTVFGAVILALIIMLSIKDRTHEIGILMALGEKRSKIVYQLLAEIVIVLVVAIGVSGVCGNTISNVIGSKLIQNEITSVEDNMQSKEMARPNKGSMNVALGIGSGSSVEPIDTLDINMNVGDFGKMAGLSLLLAMVATLIPSISIMRLNPKTILSKHS